MSLTEEQDLIEKFYTNISFFKTPYITEVDLVFRPKNVKYYFVYHRGKFLLPSSRIRGNIFEPKGFKYSGKDITLGDVYVRNELGER